MLRLFTIVFFLCLFLSHKGQGDMEALMKSEMHSAQQKIEFKHSSFADDYDLRYHRLEWKVDPAIQAISGSVTSYFVPLIFDLDTVQFDLKANMQVDSVFRNGIHLNYLHEGDVLKIAIGEVMEMGQVDSVTVHYHGEPLTEGLGTFHAGQHNGTPELWTLSEPYGAMAWWPCKQDLNDKIDSIDVLVSCPSGNRVASNGLLIEEIVTGDQTLFHWKHRYPIPAYLIAIAVTNYEQYSDFVPLENGAQMEVLNYSYPENLEDWQAASGDIVDIMGFFIDRFEDYPYPNEKYGHAQFGRGGGMEHTTMSFMGGMYFNLMAHELAHQWFGDKITCGTWEDIWLNEGFATYLTALCDEEFRPEQWSNWKASAISDVCSDPGGSVRVDDLSSVNRIFSGRLSYRKGALLLHMLRWELGDEIFFQSIQSYLADPELAYGYATTPDLVHHFENTSGEDLTEFFADWYFGQGYPSHIIAYTQTGNTLQVDIDQSQSHPSVDFFEMIIPIQFIGAEQDTTLLFQLEHDGQSFERELDFPVLHAVFDPERWLVSKSNVLYSGVDALTEENGINVFPNPANNLILFTVKNEVSNKARVIIYNEQGKEVRAEALSRGQRFSIDIQTLASGVYVLKLIDGNSELETRFTKE